MCVQNKSVSWGLAEAFKLKDARNRGIIVAGDVDALIRLRAEVRPKKLLDKKE